MATNRICSIPECGKAHYGHGWCTSHYTRHRRHGDPLAGRTPDGERARYFIEVVLPFSGKECLLWPYSCTHSGYGQVTMDGRIQLVTRLACAAKNGAPPAPNLDAAHSCGKGHLGCCNPNHLSWKTRKANSDDTLIHGTRLFGEQVGSSKLTEDEVRTIRSLGGTMLQREIAEIVGTSRSNVGLILNRKNWAWLE